MIEKDAACEHLMEWKLPMKSDLYVCEECVQTGDRWVHLRTCQSCGITLCCNSSPNRHASRHAELHGHPLAISAEPGERWVWCYLHNKFLVY